MALYGAIASNRSTRTIPAWQPFECQRFGHCGSTDQIKNASIRRALVVRRQLRLSDLSFEVLDFGLASLG
jgi:hypothetical protein